VRLCVHANPSIGQASFDSLIACTEISAETARLACFDREMRELGKNGPQPPTRAAPTAEQQFGLSSKQVLSLEAGPREAATVVHAHIASLTRAAYERQYSCSTIRRAGNRSNSIPTLRRGVVRQSRFRAGRSVRSGCPPTRIIGHGSNEFNSGCCTQASCNQWIYSESERPAWSRSPQIKH